MPCRDDFDDYEQQRLLERNTELAQLLCYACQTLEERGAMPASSTLSKWWRNHKAADARRRADEQQLREREAAHDRETYEALRAKHGW